MILLAASAGALAVTCAVLALAGPIGPLATVTRLCHPERRALDDAGWRWPLVWWEVLRAGCAAACAPLALVAAIPPLPSAALAALVPSIVMRERAASNRARARREMTRIVAAVHAALRSGEALPDAIRRACDASSERLARAPFDRSLRAFALGESLDSALRAAAAREHDDRTRVVLETFALGVGERLAVDRVAAVVGSLADRMSYDERLEEEIRARAAGARMQVRLLACLVPCLAAYLALTTPGIAEILGGPVGRSVLLPAAAVLEVTGIVLSRRAVAAVPA